MRSSSELADLHLQLGELGGRSGINRLCQGAPRNGGIGFHGHSSMSSSSELKDLHFLLGKLGGRSRFRGHNSMSSSSAHKDLHLLLEELGGILGFVCVSRSPSEPRGWISLLPTV